ncbi:MAG TPA: PAS domain-containing protein [Dongiaceae bacterium]
MNFQTFHASIVSEDLRAVAAHWQAARGVKRMPAWGDIDPIQLGRRLRFVWAWRYDRTSQLFTGRLAGDDIVHIFGKSPRGMPMAEFFPPEVYRIFHPWHLRVVQEPAFLRGRGRVYSDLGRNFDGERILMPLAEDGDHGDGILGVTFYQPMAYQSVAGSETRKFSASDLDDDQAFFSLDEP